jgi:hypothetical protein
MVHFSGKLPSLRESLIMSLMIDQSNGEREGTETAIADTIFALV